MLWITLWMKWLKGLLNPKITALALNRSFLPQKYIVLVVTIRYALLLDWKLSDKGFTHDFSYRCVTPVYNDNPERMDRSEKSIANDRII